MRITDLIKHLNGLGIYPFVEGGKLKTRSESAHVDPQAALLIRTYKDALIEFFSADSGLGAASGETIAPREDRDAPAPLSFAQQRLWFLDQLGEAASAAYHVPAALRLSGRLNVDALKATLNRVVARHESLRTVFETTADGEVHQRVLDPAEVPDVVEVRTAGADVTEVTREFLTRAFDLRTTPPIRVQVAQVDAPDESSTVAVLTIAMHHIATDEWSAAPLRADLDTAYHARAQQIAPEWDDLALQYSDFAAWQRDLLADDRGRRELDFWRRALDGSPEELSLPTTGPDLRDRQVVATESSSAFAPRRSWHSRSLPHRRERRCSWCSRRPWRSCCRDWVQALTSRSDRRSPCATTHASTNSSASS